MKVKITPSDLHTPLSFRVPPSKSIAHRAIICASLAGGTSTISNIDYSDDISATIQCMEKLGAVIKKQSDSLIITGAEDITACCADSIDCCESGSTLRFLIPIFSLCGREICFTGKGRLMDRPQSVYQKLFCERGLCFKHESGLITVNGKLQSGEFTVDGNVSSQFITGLLFTLPLLDGNSVIKIVPPFESRSYIDITLDVLSDFGISAVFTDDYTIQIKGNQRYIARDYTVEGDYSQLAFFAVMGACGVPVHCTGVSENSKQGDRVILDIVGNAGAEIKEQNGLLISGESLTGREISIADCPDLGPILTVLGMFSHGRTVITNAERLRYKESDRIAAMEQELRKLGVDISSTDGEIIIDSKDSYACMEELSSHNDHRIAMSLAVASVCGKIPVVIDGAECIRKSYPSFFDDLKSAGVKTEVLA